MLVALALAGCQSSGAGSPDPEPVAKTVEISGFLRLGLLDCDSVTFSANVSQGDRKLRPAEFVVVGPDNTSGEPIPLEDLNVGEKVKFTIQVTENAPIGPVKCKPFLVGSAWQFESWLKRKDDETYVAQFNVVKDKEEWPPKPQEPDQGMNW